MAVVVTKNPSGLKLRFDCGTDEITGKTITKSKTYSNIKPDTLEQDVFEVGNAISSLQQHTLIEVAKLDNATLSE